MMGSWFFSLPFSLAPFPIWPIVFFVVVVVFFSTLVQLSRSWLLLCESPNHKRKKHAKKPPAEQANRKTRQEPIT